MGIKQFCRIKPGQLFSLYCVLYGFFRFVIEFLRINPKYLIGLSGAQFISILMMVIGAYFMYSFRKSLSLSRNLFI